MQTAAPARTLAQRMEALRKGNGIRSRRARLKAQMHASQNGGGKQQALELLTEVPDWAESMKALDLLLAIPKVGRVKANRLMNKVPASPSKTLGGLSERQRGALSNEIRKV